MKVFFQISLILFISKFCASQNLISNPSFEILNSCYGAPATVGFDVFEWSSCEGWNNPIYSSSDLWCQNPVVGNITPPQIPGIGYQIPRTGDCMAGFLIGDPIVRNYREYVQNKLIETLEPLKFYRFSCYISTCCLPCTVSNIGISLSSQKIQNNNWNLNDVTRYGVNEDSNFLDDTLGWKRIEIDFLASGEENYIQIGCFVDSSHLSIMGCAANNNEFISNYYFIDDVELTEIGEFNFPNIITPNNDGINDFLDLSFIKGNWKASVINRWGNVICDLNSSNSIWNLNNSEEVIDGVYFLIFETNDFHFSCFLTIVR